MEGPQLLLCREPCAGPAAQHTPSVVLASVAPDGRHALLAHADGRLTLIDLHGNSTQPTSSFSLCLRHSGGGACERVARPLSALVWGADGLLLAQRGSGKILFCPDPATLQGEASAPVFLFGSQLGHVTTLAPDLSGSLLASADSKGELCVWGLAYGARLAAAHRAHAAGGASALCFLGADVVASGGGDGTVRVWRLVGGALSLEAKWAVVQGASPVHHLSSCTNAQGAQLLAAGTAAGAVLVWAQQPQGGGWRTLGTLGAGPGSGGGIASLSLRSSASQLAVAHGATLSLYQLPSLALLQHRRYAAAVAGAAFLLSGQLVVCIETGECAVEDAPSPALAATASAALGAAAVAAVAVPQQPKCVHFADSCGAPGAVPEVEPSCAPPPPLPPHPLRQLQQLRRSSGSSGATSEQRLPSAEAEEALPAAPAAAIGSPGQSWPPSAAAEAQVGVRAASSAAVEGEEAPRLCQPPVRTLPQQRHPLPQQRQQQAQLSRRCDACTILSSRAASPSVVGSPSQVQEQRQQQPECLASPSAAAAAAGGGAVSSGPEPRAWPPSPIKEGVSLTRADQEAGEALPPSTARVTVIEHETRLAHLEVRSERLARLSRRVLPSPSPGARRAAETEQPPYSGSGGQVAAEGAAETGRLGEAESPVGAECAKLVTEVAAGVAAADELAAVAAAASSTGPPPFAQPGPPKPQRRPPSSGGERQQAALAAVNQQLSGLDLRLGQLLHSVQQHGAAILSSAAPGQPSSAPAGAPASQAPPWAQYPSVTAAGAQGEQMNAHAAAPAVVVQPPAPVQRSRQAPSMLPKPPPLAAVAITAGAAQAPLAAAAPPPPLSPALAAPAQLLGGLEGATGAPEPPPARLAVPQLNSSLLLLAAKRQEPSAPSVTEQEEREARARAATAATTYPLHATVFPPKPAAAGDAASAAKKKVPKQLDARWVAERELQPRLEDLWCPPQQVAGYAPVPPPALQASPRHVAAQLLGLWGLD